MPFWPRGVVGKPKHPVRYIRFATMRFQKGEGVLSMARLVGFLRLPGLGELSVSSFVGFLLGAFLSAVDVVILLPLGIAYERKEKEKLEYSTLCKLSVNMWK